MILKSQQVSNSQNVSVQIPAMSVPHTFIQQSGKIMFWYSDSGEPVNETHRYLFAKKGVQIPDNAKYFCSIKLPGNGYAQVFEV